MANLFIVPVISNVRHDGEDLSIGDSIQVAETQLTKLNAECFAIDKARPADGSSQTTTQTENDGGSDDSETKPRRGGGGRRKAANSDNPNDEKGGAV